MPEKFHFAPIGVLQSPFKEKFGVPRQSLMVSEARAVLKLHADARFPVALTDLERFTHVWVVFVFHQNDDRPWRPTIEPPRLSISRRVGVFASRSPHRPNPIGLSAVKLEKIDLEAPGGVEIHLSGVDILDGSPVLDIKPYLPYADRIEAAGSGWADGEVERYAVDFTPEAMERLTELAPERPGLAPLLRQMLEWDPRPTSLRRSMPLLAPETEGRPFAFRVMDLDVHWQVRQGVVRVLQIERLPR